MLELINYRFQHPVISNMNQIELNLPYKISNVLYDNKCDSDGNFYVPFTQSTNLTDSYIVSFNKKGEFRWCKLLKDTTASLNGRQMVLNIDVDENKRVHCYGKKRLVPQNSNDADGFYVIFNQDGSVYKNLGYSDDPAASYYEAIYGCLTNDHSVMVGVKWSNTYNSARPHLFIFDKIGNLQKSLWSNIKTPVNRFYNVFSIPNTNNIIMTNMDTLDYNATGVTRFINYNISTNKIDFNMSFNTLTQGALSTRQRAGCVLFDKDNNMYFIGYLYSSPNFIHIIKTDKNGSILFSKTYFEAGKHDKTSYIRGFKIIDSILYLGCLTNTSDECLVCIDCETGNVKTSFINNGTAKFSQIGGYDKFLSSLSVSSEGYLNFANLFLNELQKDDKIKIGNYFDLKKNNFTTADVGTKKTNYSDISLANASYTVSTTLNISNITMISQKKFNGTGY